ncbi:MAG: response regulator [Nitrospirae bacterium]|nr:response regulator [Nitrospirota bacterium]
MSMKLSAVKNFFLNHFLVKMLAISVGSIIAISILFVSFTIYREYNLLRRNLLNQGRLLMQVLTYNAKLGVFTENERILETAALSVMQHNDVGQVTIFNKKGQILIKRIKDSTMPEDPRRNSRKFEQVSKTQLMTIDDEGSYFDLWMPIVSKSGIFIDTRSMSEADALFPKNEDLLGIANIELSKKAINKNIYSLVVKDVIMALVCSLMIISIIYVVTKRATLSIRQLTNNVKTFAAGKQTEHMPSYTSDEIGEVIEAFNNMVDALQKEEAEKKMLEQHIANLQKIEAVSILAGGIAHDFNNILTSLLGKVHLCKRNVGNHGKVIEKLTEAEDIIKQSKHLANKMVALANGGHPKKQITSIEGLIRDTTKSLLAGTNVNCNISTPENLYLCETDKEQITQVINNVILNAKDSMPEGGTIDIIISNILIEKTAALPLERGKYVKISITDHGHGIPEDMLDKVFIPFFTTRSNRTGLGLTLSYTIVIRHGGYIDVDSKIGVGTTFNIYLPATDKRLIINQPGFTTDSVEQGSYRSMMVLLLDDNEHIIKDLSEILGNFNCEIISAKSGAEAINLFKKHKKIGLEIDFVIIDLKLPDGVAGESVLKELLEIDSSVKAIAISGYSGSDVMSNYKKHGFIGALPKPFSPAELYALLQTNISA